MDDLTTTDGRHRFEIVHAEDYDDDPVGDHMHESCLGLFSLTDNGTWVLESFWDVDTLADALGVS